MIRNPQGGRYSISCPPPGWRARRCCSLGGHRPIAALATDYTIGVERDPGTAVNKPQ
ncbi:MAG: hypothetical protein IPJ56_05240 [Gemmatimonadetes bacterium]|nr:hypothetical protein [Gemmatimonadota bacterium]